jgi:flagellar biosynthesis/type III secretory pathway protein FliH
LKRLSVHLAEQLVLAELNLSGASIERLIQRCLDELSSHSHQSITVELNSQDKARLQELSGEMFNNIQLHAVSSMQPGSVRVITDDTQVDDLIGHRLEALAQNLLAQPELWREQSPFFKQPWAQRDSDFEDVRQRPSLIADKFEENRDD